MKSGVRCRTFKICAKRFGVRRLDASFAPDQHAALGTYRSQIIYPSEKCDVDLLKRDSRQTLEGLIGWIDDNPD
jgi:hypothetical protein